MERTRQVYETCLKVIPHRSFTFAKLWLLYAKFEVRQLQLTKARKTLGQALGMCPKNKLFKGYIELELGLKEYDRCRTLYHKYLEYNPSHCQAWIGFTELERMLQDYDRVRAIFELAVSQPVLDMPESLWKAYIDFEMAEQSWSHARSLYRRLLEKTDHVKAWTSFAAFELQIIGADEDERVERARNVFQQAYEHYKQQELKEERVALLEEWSAMEQQYGTEETLALVQAKKPKIVKKRRKLASSSTTTAINKELDEEGTGVTWKEYLDYVFPDDEDAQKPNLKLLALAHQWKKKMQEHQAAAK